MHAGARPTSDPTQTPVTPAAFSLLPPLLRRLLATGVLPADGWDDLSGPDRSAALAARPTPRP